MIASSHWPHLDYYEFAPKDFHIIGYDGAGTVLEVGPEVTYFKVGDDVSWVGATTRQGSYAEYQLVSEFMCAHKPKKLDFVEAASFGLTFGTAYQSLNHRLEVKPNDDAGILIVSRRSFPWEHSPSYDLYALTDALFSEQINGGGGVGSAAIQLARHVLRLPVVVATASRQDTMDSCKKMGATHVVNHHKDLVEEIKALNLDVPIRYAYPSVWSSSASLLTTYSSYVYVLAPTEQYVHAIAKICAPFAKVCTIVQADVSLYGTDFMSKSMTFSWDWLGTGVYHKARSDLYHDIFQTLASLMDEGKLFPTLTKRYKLTLEGLKEAHRQIESKTTVGKVGLGVDEPGEGTPFAWGHRRHQEIYQIAWFKISRHVQLMT